MTPHQPSSMSSQPSRFAFPTKHDILEEWHELSWQQSQIPISQPPTPTSHSPGEELPQRDDSFKHAHKNHE